MDRFPPLRLVVVGREYLSRPLEKPVCLIGREVDNDLVLDSPTVSRHHARLFLAADGWRIQDLQSRNGVAVRGVKAPEAPLELGDDIKIGDTVLRVEPIPGSTEDDDDQTMAMASVPFVAQTTCATCGNRMGIPNLIEEVIRQNPNPMDLDQRLAEALRREFGAEGVFLFSVRDAEGRSETKVETACRYETSSEEEGLTVLSRSTLREALKEKSPVWAPMDLVKPGQSLKGLSGAQILIYPFLIGGRVSALLYLDWGKPCQDPIPPMTVLGSWPTWATVLLEALWDLRAASARADQEARHGEALSQAFRRRIDPGEIIGSSSALQEALNRASAAAPSPYPILLLGETGVGKEVFARWVHLHSARSDGPFIALNCAGIPAGTAESELFGHRRGAFTGADRDHAGVFEQAEGGTLFLDEIGDMDLALQAKVLRAIQFGVIRRVGDDRERAVDVRLIAATHHDLRQAILDKAFREDLYYRLTTFELNLPPLRQRPSDIPILATTFLSRAFKKAGTATGFTPGALSALKECGWPGNVRQLESAVNHLSASASGPLIEESDVRRLLGSACRPGGASSEDVLSAPFKRAQEMFEETYLRSVLERAGGNVSEAARLSDLPRRTFYNLLDRHPELKE
jgi:transcriptional regulator with GAF, ATPase, and Fis domain